jgi:hypothetical protein
MMEVRLVELSAACSEKLQARNVDHVTALHWIPTPQYVPFKRFEGPFKKI